MSFRKTILVLTSGPLCRNPRTLKEAWTLGDAGYDVTVMTVANDAAFEAIDDRLLQNAPFKKRALSLISSGIASSGRQFFQRSATWFARKSVRFGYETAQAFGPYQALLRMARSSPADLTIAHTEVGLCIASLLANEGRRVAADFEDWHSEDLLPAAQAFRPRKLLRKVELHLLRRATYTTTTSAALASALERAAGSRAPIVITNSFPLQPAHNGRDVSSPPSILWFSQTIGPGRGLEAFLAAWSHARADSHVSLLGAVDENYRAHLLNRLSPIRRDQITFLPLTSPWQLPAVIAAHDVGLALEATTPASRNLTITNKILQYLNAGLAIIASRTTGQDEVLANAPDAGISVNVDNASEVASQLDVLLCDPARLRAMGAAARRAAEANYCWERESPRLLRAVEVALRS